MDYLLYLGRSSTKHYAYLSFTTTDLQACLNLDLAAIKETYSGRSWTFDTKLFKLGSVMSVYEFGGIKEDSVSYNSKKTPCAYWNNVTVREFYRTVHAAIETSLKAERDNKTKHELIALDTIKRAYKKSSTVEKASIIANIVTYLNA